MYKGFWRRSTSTSLFIKGSAQIVEPPQITYKGTKFKYYIKGDILRAIIIRTKKFAHNKSGLGVILRTNDLLVIKKKQTLKSKYIKGVVSRNALNKKKLLVLFSRVY